MKFYYVSLFLICFFLFPQEDIIKPTVDISDALVQRQEELLTKQRRDEQIRQDTEKEQALQEYNRKIVSEALNYLQNYQEKTNQQTTTIVDILADDRYQEQLNKSIVAEYGEPGTILSDQQARNFIESLTKEISKLDFEPYKQLIQLRAIKELYQTYSLADTTGKIGKTWKALKGILGGEGTINQAKTFFQDLLQKKASQAITKILTELRNNRTDALQNAIPVKTRDPQLYQTILATSDKFFNESIEVLGEQLGQSFDDVFKKQLSDFQELDKQISKKAYDAWQQTKQGSFEEQHRQQKTVIQKMVQQGIKSQDYEKFDKLAMENATKLYHSYQDTLTRLSRAPTDSLQYISSTLESLQILLKNSQIIQTELPAETKQLRDSINEKIIEIKKTQLDVILEPRTFKNEWSRKIPGQDIEFYQKKFLQNIYQTIQEVYDYTTINVQSRALRLDTLKQQKQRLDDLKEAIKGTGLGEIGTGTVETQIKQFNNPHNYMYREIAQRADEIESYLENCRAFNCVENGFPKATDVQEILPLGNYIPQDQVKLLTSTFKATLQENLSGLVDKPYSLLSIMPLETLKPFFDLVMNPLYRDSLALSRPGGDDFLELITYMYGFRNPEYFNQEFTSSKIKSLTPEQQKFVKAIMIAPFDDTNAARIGIEIALKVKAGVATASEIATNESKEYWDSWLQIFSNLCSGASKKLKIVSAVAAAGSLATGIIALFNTVVKPLGASRLKIGSLDVTYGQSAVGLAAISGVTYGLGKAVEKAAVSLSPFDLKKLESIQNSEKKINFTAKVKRFFQGIGKLISRVFVAFTKSGSAARRDLAIKNADRARQNFLQFIYKMTDVNLQAQSSGYISEAVIRQHLNKTYEEVEKRSKTNPRIRDEFQKVLSEYFKASKKTVDEFSQFKERRSEYITLINDANMMNLKEIFNDIAESDPEMARSKFEDTFIGKPGKSDKPHEPTYFEELKTQTTAALSIVSREASDPLSYKDTDDIAKLLHTLFKYQNDSIAELWDSVLRKAKKLKK